MEDENEDLVPMPRGGGVSLRQMSDRVTGQRQPQPQPGAATISRTTIHPKFAFSPCELLRQLLRLVYCFVHLANIPQNILSAFMWHQRLGTECESAHSFILLDYTPTFQE